jgi:hypothetical protein
MSSMKFSVKRYEAVTISRITVLHTSDFEPLAQTKEICARDRCTHSVSLYNCIVAQKYTFHVVFQFLVDPLNLKILPSKSDSTRQRPDLH